jgi:hypothetical protein
MLERFVTCLLLTRGHKPLEQGSTLMTRTVNARRRLLAAGIVVTGLLTLGSAATAGAATNDPKSGKACTVTGGPNKGKTGTYTTEAGNGHSWCEGKDFSTECTGSDKCKDAKKLVVTPPRQPGLVGVIGL